MIALSILATVLLSQIHPELKPHPRAQYMYRLNKEQVSTNEGCVKGYSQEVVDPKTGHRDNWCIPKKCYSTQEGKSTCYELD